MQKPTRCWIQKILYLPTYQVEGPKSVLSSTIHKSPNFSFQIHNKPTIQIQGGHFLFENNSLSLLVCLFGPRSPTGPKL